MPLVTYSVLRLALLAACFALGYWAGLRTWLLLGVAVLAAWALSYVLLEGPRDAAATYLATRSRRGSARGGEGHGVRGPTDADEAHEDAVVDRAAAGVGGASPRVAAETTVADGTAEGSDAEQDRQGGTHGVGRPYPGETASPRPNSAP